MFAFILSFGKALKAVKTQLNETLMNLPMNLQVGRVTPCAPQDRAWHPDGARGYAPYRLNGFRGARLVLRGILTASLFQMERRGFDRVGTSH